MAGIEGERIFGEPVKEIDSIVVREVLLRTYSGFVVRPFDPYVVKNQEQQGRTLDDAAHMVSAHLRWSEQGLGMRETSRRQFVLTVGDEQLVVQETTPHVVTSWISWANSPSELYTPAEAGKINYGWRTALNWATQGGEPPEMVVKAGGYFYPASSGDKIVSTDLYTRNQ